MRFISLGEHQKKRTIITRVVIAGGCACLAILCVVFHDYLVWSFKQLPIVKRFFKVSVGDQVFKYGATARTRLIPKFQQSGLHYPPDRVAYIANKSTRELSVYAAAVDSQFKFICKYPILGASGHLGPKLKEGDLQVPEGLYELTLEPNTPYHVALRLNYPNAFDLARAGDDGRSNPGSDILIHGTTGSIGCIAVGDPASEELFVLSNDTGKRITQLIIVPFDLRKFDRKTRPNADGEPKWLPELYTKICEALKQYPEPPSGAP